MTEDFTVRATHVEVMLKAPTSAFVLVTSAHDASIDEAIWFGRTLHEGGLPFAGVVVNRVHHDMLGDRAPGAVAAALGGELGAELGPELATQVADNFHDYHVLARRDDRNIARLAAELDGRPLVLVPHLDDDVHDVDGLLRMHQYLFASGDERERLLAEVVA
jgi:anion-transporting  ArsA/GET3 family ATPase